MDEMQGRVSDKTSELKKEIKELVELLTYIRDEVVFGNAKHVERINDVLNKKSVKKGD